VASGNKDNGDGIKNGENPNGEDSEFENFQRLLKQVLSVPKGEVDEKREQEKNEERAG
jgi:hypothetical protein